MTGPNLNLLLFQFQVILLIVFLLSISISSAENTTDYLKSIRNCFGSNQTLTCIKETALDYINETVYSDQVMDFGVFQVMKDANFYSKITAENIPTDNTRSLALTDAIYDKIEEFFKSRIVKIRLGEAVEARKKGGGGGYKGGYGGGKKGGGLLILGGIAMAGMMAQLFMGKIAFLAGTALLLAKMALVMATIATFKKSGGDRGGSQKESAHVIYAKPETHGGGGHNYGHGGGWHRSLSPEEIQQSAYNSYAMHTLNEEHIPPTANNDVGQYQTKKKRK